MEYALGPVYRQFFSLILAFLNLALTLNPLIFFIKTFHNLTNMAAGEETNISIFIVITILIFAPLTWVRTVESF